MFFVVVLLILWIIFYSHLFLAKNIFGALLSQLDLCIWKIICYVFIMFQVIILSGNDKVLL